MSRESCIAHQPKQAIAIIRTDYYRLMERDACGAALLNLFEYWANAAIAAEPDEERPWVGARPIREFEQMLLGISTDKQIRKRLALLEGRGFIETQLPARRGAAKTYRVMVPEIQQALAGHLTEGVAAGRSCGVCQMTGEKQGRRSFDQRAVGCLTDEPVVIRPVKLRSNDRALKKDLKEFKKEKEEKPKRNFSSLSSKQDLPSSSAPLSAGDSAPIPVGTITYTQPPESIDYADLWEKDPVRAKSQLRQIAPGHRRLEMVAHGLGHWWVGPGLNDFDPALIQACRNRKRKFQQPDGIRDAKTFINNMLRNGDWGNFVLRCEEALALRARSAETAVAKVGKRQRSPFEKTEEERRASALGLARFKVAQGEIARGREISRQFGLSMVEIGLSADATFGHACRSQAA